MFNFLRLSVSGTALILACATVCFAANPNSPFYTTRVGDYNLTIVSDGAGPLLPLDGFVAGVHEAAFKQVLNSRFLSGIQNLDMNVPFLDMGDKKLLFDAGSGGVLGPAFGKLVDNMRKAGLDPEEVDTVVITHAHPDHIGGILAPDGSLAFPNANYMIPRVEYEFWRDVSFEDAIIQNSTIPEELRQRMTDVPKSVLSVIEDKLVVFELGEEVFPGITSKATPGHTLGHSVFIIRSGDESFIITGDAFPIDYVNIEHPEWHLRTDLLPDVGIETRFSMLNELADNRMRGAYYHLSFPGIGNIYRSASGFRFRPINYAVA